MTAPLLRCARCHRRLVHVAAWMAGLPLGRNCANGMKAAVLASPTPIELAAERTTRAEEAAFRARQIPLIEATA